MFPVIKKMRWKKNTERPAIRISKTCCRLFCYSAVCTCCLMMMFMHCVCGFWVARLSLYVLMLSLARLGCCNPIMPDPSSGSQELTQTECSTISIEWDRSKAGQPTPQSKSNPEPCHTTNCPGAHWCPILGGNPRRRLFSGRCTLTTHTTEPKNEPSGINLQGLNQPVILSWFSIQCSAG